jgi:hypothetical protein
VTVTKNPLLQEEFALMIRQLLANIEPKLGEFNELDGRMKYVGICALFCLHYRLYRTEDKRQLKAIWDVYKKVIFRNISYDVLSIYLRSPLFISVVMSVGQLQNFY